MAELGKLANEELGPMHNKRVDALRTRGELSAAAACTWSNTLEGAASGKEIGAGENETLEQAVCAATRANLRKIDEVSAAAVPRLALL